MISELLATSIIFAIKSFVFVVALLFCFGLAYLIICFFVGIYLKYFAKKKEISAKKLPSFLRSKIGKGKEYGC